ncbi:FAD-dependent oxidoreductase [Kangiella shandongensis]|uniref:FAD-dependent oxidoreductase n=1 Tax=Kangiella shandongensis TaxID=2763258 RepID=UPI001CC01820|nr:NAD(P)/FAD-dependent oxidoreductase [Kangiella shandongensis]
MSDKNHITLIGAGLVGSLMSIYLGQRGYRVNVYEKLPDIRNTSIPAGRSINLALANRGIRALEQVGIIDKVNELLIPMKGRMLHDVAGKLTLQPYGRKPEEVIYSVSRAGLVSLLRDEAEATGNVTFHFEQELTDISPDNKTVSIQNEKTNEEETLEYDILLGADGAGSQTRQTLERLGVDGFSSELLKHSYKELTIPAGDSKTPFQIEKEALHIWPRGGYMLIALPNLDGSFTVTLFMPNEGPVSFDAFDSKEAVEAFFQEQFSDVLELIPNLADDYFNNPTGILGTVRSKHWSYKDILLFGDASHAIVPFHGQGMNCGFEDCSELHRLLNKHSDDWSAVMPEFEAVRKENANAIADMALENYVEMRDSVRDPKFQLKKQIAFKLEELYPTTFIPRYSMVMFHHMPYAEAYRRGKVQNDILNQLTEGHDEIEHIDWKLAHELVQQNLEPFSKELLH